MEGSRNRRDGINVSESNPPYHTLARNPAAAASLLSLCSCARSGAFSNAGARVGCGMGRGGIGRRRILSSQHHIPPQPPTSSTLYIYSWTTVRRPTVWKHLLRKARVSVSMKGSAGWRWVNEGRVLMQGGEGWVEEERKEDEEN